MIAVSNAFLKLLPIVELGSHPSVLPSAETTTREAATAEVNGDAFVNFLLLRLHAQSGLPTLVF
jgi:hypothetical protein